MYVIKSVHCSPCKILDLHYNFVDIFFPFQVLQWNALVAPIKN